MHQSRESCAANSRYSVGNLTSFWQAGAPGPALKVWRVDQGYDADAILADLDRCGIAAVIPPKRNRKVQPVIAGHIYALRNLVERRFSKLKHSRGLATRYDKNADSYIGFALVVSACL